MVCTIQQSAYKTCRSPLQAEMPVVHTTPAGFLFKDDIMKRILLTQGKFALVDNEDFKWLNQWKWHARFNKFNWYVARSVYRSVYTSRGRKKRINNKCIYMHRLILGLEDNDNNEPDHKDGNGLNNQRFNLRRCSHQQNTQNKKKRINKTSRYKGVCKSHKKWCASIRNNNNLIHLGYFRNEVVAAKVYDQKAKELFGEFARTNF